MMKTSKPFLTLAAGCVISAAGFNQSADADVLLSTDFNNSGVDGSGDMTDVVWVEDGLSAPTTLDASAAIRSGLGGAVDAEGGYLSGDVNVNGTTVGSPAWSLAFDVTVGPEDVDLTSIVLASAEANSSATLDAGNGSSNINLTISGTAIDLTEVRSGSVTPVNLTYTTPVTLSANTDYTVTFTVWEGTSSGHFEGFDKLTFNGTVVPEPGSLALLGLGGLLIASRRRRA